MVLKLLFDAETDKENLNVSIQSANCDSFSERFLASVADSILPRRHSCSCLLKAFYTTCRMRPHRTNLKRLHDAGIPAMKVPPTTLKEVGSLE